MVSFVIHEILDCGLSLGVSAEVHNLLWVRPYRCVRRASLKGTGYVPRQYKASYSWGHGAVILISDQTHGCCITRA